MLIFLYGPPGSGKTTIGLALSKNLAYKFTDLDEQIQNRAGRLIADIFAAEGEAGFRRREAELLSELVTSAQIIGRGHVIALGGGALFSPENRAMAEASGPVVFLDATFEILLQRLLRTPGKRPLIAEDTANRLEALMVQRSSHYASFQLRVNAEQTAREAAWAIQVLLGIFHITGMEKGYDVHFYPGGLEHIGEALAHRKHNGPMALVSDETVAGYYAARVIASLEAAGYRVSLIKIPPGEQHKTIDTVNTLWAAFLAGGLERGSTVLALGGGVVGDLVGFAAATYLRGVMWVNLPTTLLAMVDASLGGKTGIDLPQGKNLAGAFHPPGLVLVDPCVLDTLPEDEYRSGLAEVIKHGLIADPQLFEICAAGMPTIRNSQDEVIRRAIAVKARIIQEDPYERGRRAALNLGHTLGHAIEKASGYQLKHGEAVAIGLLYAARLARTRGVAEDHLVEQIEAALSGVGLPTSIPAELDLELVRRSMGYDKKKDGGKLRWVLPVRVGEVLTSMVIDDDFGLFSRND